MNTNLINSDGCHVYLRLANQAFTDIRLLVAQNDLAQINEIADSLHNLGNWEFTRTSLIQLVKDFPTDRNHDLLNIFKETKRI